jgi:hypothetical protein
MHDRAATPSCGAAPSASDEILNIARSRFLSGSTKGTRVTVAPHCTFGPFTGNVCF